MAVLFHDGLDHYGTGNIPNSLVQAGGFVASGYSIPTVTIPLQTTYARYSAAFNGAVASCGASLPSTNVADSIWIKRAVPSWIDKIVVGFAIQPNGAPPSEVQVFEFNATAQVSILPDMRVKAFNKITTYKLEVGVYYFFEVQVDKAGNGSLWVSNMQVGDATGLDPVITGWHIMAKSVFVSTNLIYVDDIYVLDGSGTTHTSRLGRTNSILRIPTATVEAGFSVSSGSALNHTYVAKSVYSGDTSYVKTNKAFRDLYGNSAAMKSTKSIKAVSIITSARREDADDFRIIPILKSGETVTDGIEYPLTQYNYIGIFQTYDFDPATGAEWLYPALLAASWGQRLKVPVF